MTKQIHTYNDLLEQEQQLELLMQAQKDLVIYDINQLKAELEPVRNTVNFVSRIITENKANLLIRGGVNKMIDVIFKKLVLARAGWLTRLMVPFFLKNYSSHFIAENKEKFMEKIFSWLGHKNGKENAEAHSYPDGAESEPF